MSELEVGEIVKRFGQAHYDKVISILKEYEAKWSLTNLQLKSHLSANLIFTCHSNQFGDAVLKIGYPDSPEIVTELNALKEYDGGKFCKVYEADIEAGIFLEEHIFPGITLRKEATLDARLAIFYELYQDLHISSDNAEVYPTYKHWVYRITEYMSSRQDCTDLYLKMENAKTTFDAISLDYNKQLLLHGDFHHDNILQNRNGSYTLIDPKGVIGDPVFDLAVKNKLYYYDLSGATSYSKSYYKAMPICRNDDGSMLVCREWCRLYGVIEVNGKD